MLSGVKGYIGEGVCHYMHVYALQRSVNKLLIFQTRFTNAWTWSDATLLHIIIHTYMYFSTCACMLNSLIALHLNEEMLYFAFLMRGSSLTNAVLVSVMK